MIRKFGTKYLIHSDGRIWKEEHTTTRSDGVVRTWKAKWQPTRIREGEKGNGGGYEYVDLDGKTYLVHRIVAELFLPNTENLSDVNHKDGNRSNNRVENLEWVSRSDNQKHAYKVLNRSRKRKLSGEEIIEICRLRNEEGLPLKVIAETFGINFRTVSEIAHNRRFVLREEGSRHA